MKHLTWFLNGLILTVLLFSVWRSFLCDHTIKYVNRKGWIFYQNTKLQTLLFSVAFPDWVNKVTTIHRAFHFLNVFLVFMWISIVFLNNCSPLWDFWNLTAKQNILSIMRNWRMVHLLCILLFPVIRQQGLNFFQISSDPIASMYWLRLMGSNANHSPFATLPLLD